MDGNNFNNEFDQELDTKKNDTYDFAYDDYEEYNPQSGANGMAITGMVIGIIVGIIGMIGCGVNYPIYKKMLENGKKKYAYEIVELAREISEGK